MARTAPVSAVRAWARAQGMSVRDRGALSADVVRAYDAAHPSSPTPPSKEHDVAAAPAKKTPAAKAPEAAPAEASGTATSGTASGSPTASPGAAPEVQAPPAGSVDLAGSLRGLLGSVDTEVRAVGVLSERIDDLVTQLNAAREEQATRLLVLDELRASVQDETLGAFLEKAVRPRRARVVEVFPERLDQE